MVVTNGRTVTVFGGTGFLGRRIVRHLRYREGIRTGDTSSLVLMIRSFNP